jgi:signal transduction histidine kinase
LVVAGVTLGGLGSVVSRRFDEPGVDAFGAYVLAIGSGAVVSGVVVTFWPAVFAVPGYRVGRLAFDAPVLLGSVLYFTFAVRFAGYGSMFSGPALGVLSVLPTVGVLGRAVTVGLAVGMVPEMGMPSVADAVTVFASTVGGLGATALVLAGAALVSRTAYIDGYLSIGQGVTLAVTGLTPLLVTNLSGVFGLAIQSLTLTGTAPEATAGTVAIAGGTVVTAVATGLTGFRYGTFRSAPATSNIGIETAIDEIADPLVVVDDEGRVVETNRVARDRLGVARPAPVGDPLDESLGVGVAELDETGTVELPTAAGRRRFDARVSPLTDGEGRLLGHTVSMRDVTDREIREQRLQVLNRVLRHNLRNKLTVVRGSAQGVADGSMDAATAADRIETATDDLIRLGDQARKVETLLGGDRRDRETARVDLASVVESAVSQVAGDFPEVVFYTEGVARFDCRVDERLLEHVLVDVVENAAEYNDADDPEVYVRTGLDRADTDYPVAVTVVDNGPGIPDHELEAIRNAEETALEHTSGIGLWATNWGVTRLGGELSFEANDPTGTVVTLSLPASVLATENTTTAAEADIAGSN